MHFQIIYYLCVYAHMSNNILSGKKKKSKETCTFDRSRYATLTCTVKCIEVVSAKHTSQTIVRCITTSTLTVKHSTVPS